MNQSHIRNFAIIAHVDHGKSTLADRLLELTGTVSKRNMQDQILDSNPIERERGITIKLAPVRMHYESSAVSRQLSENLSESGKLITDSYILNLIDTPGHVDFSYEVSRSLAACEGAILVVDSTQGVQAQTLAHLTQARKHNLVIIPVINKIDLHNARIKESVLELGSLGFRENEILLISAKTGENVEQILEAIVKYVPPPKGVPSGTLRALVFSSQYDSHKGVVVFVRIADGNIGGSTALPSFGMRFVETIGFTSRKNPRLRNLPILRFMVSGAEIAPLEIGYFSPKMMPCDTLRTGEVGYIATGLKDVKLAKVGDTITVVSDKLSVVSKDNKQCNPQLTTYNPQPLSGYHEPKSMVFVSLFPVSADNYQASREAMERLRLSDSAFTFRPISSLALGNGFHCGFLGLLHAEIVQERLSREFNLNMIATAPSVEYKLKVKSEKLKIELDGYMHIQSANEYPDPTFIDETMEPVMQVTIYTPKRYVGPIMQLSEEKRGTYVDLKYTADQAEFTYLIPLSEMIIDFFDRLKSITEGYASLDYEFFDYQMVDVVKIDILVNKEKVDALSFLVVRDQAHTRSIEITDRLAAVIPRAQFEVPIQAAIGGKVVARSDVKAFRKDVIQKLYGGDRTRKDKLLKKQKKGKERMKLIGRVRIPQEAFFQVLKRD
ncbi:elongation factor 4 [Patescibacteria group bacterium]|nr:elongation factor 4 [Patescibacteria group bacterium]MBU2459891.1 elongation factor 4 [Patescibacteria group bacterium]MBU2544730.1 elongation factor 4 [Patescibacteria group bacterium]